MQPLLAWLPTIVAVITAAVALGGSRTKLDTIETLLREVRSEGKDLAAKVQETLTAKAVTSLAIDQLRAQTAALDAECARLSAELSALRTHETEARHKLRDEMQSHLTRLETRIDARPHP